jgi:alkylhydroperoxidase family enzyme
VLTALLDDVESAPVRDELKPLFGYVHRLTLTPSRMTPADAEAVFAAGWDEQVLYTVVSVCALFNLMNRLVEGVGLTVRDEAYFAVAARRLSGGTDYAGYRRLVDGA